MVCRPAALLRRRIRNHRRRLNSPMRQEGGRLFSADRVGMRRCGGDDQAFCGTLALCAAPAPCLARRGRDAYDRMPEVAGNPAVRNLFGIVAIVAVLVLPPMQGIAAAPRAGEVLGLYGQCFVEAGGQRKRLTEGDPVHVGDAVDVAAGARLKLRMNDGSVIAVASGSRLTITDYRVGDGGKSRNALLSLGAGLLRAVVSSLEGSSHFEIDTATAVAAVRSTDWFLEAQPGATRVGVLAGRVSLKSVATGTEIVIPARWGSRVEAGRDPVPARVWSGAEFDDFIRRTNVAPVTPR
jgi:FecR protein